jgi:hypothetical protein
MKYLPDDSLLPDLRAHAPPQIAAAQEFAAARQRASYFQNSRLRD